MGGNYVPASLWSKPQLLSTSTPIPNWILITRQGAITNATTLPSLSTMADSSFNNPNYVIGRYAYAIYDEGGLIDVNVAGNGLTAACDAQRGRLNQAALGQIPLVDDTPGSTANVNAANALIAWRSATSSMNTNNWIYSPTNTFLTVLPGDQAFVSRQDLLNYGASQGYQSSAYQNLGVFSRELNAPDFTPDPNRPRVLATSSSVSTPYVSKYNWIGPSGVSQTFPLGFGVGNPNSYGLDDKYNPSLANFRNSSSGNPIMKQRFPLSRLSWLTYLGPIADASGNLNPTGDGGVATEITIYENAGIPASYLAQGTAANIKTYFGLTWDTGNNQWIYSSPEGSAPALKINTFSAIPSSRTTGPDFFETLMATISVGSVGRDAGPPGVVNEDQNVARYYAATGLASDVLLQDQNIYRHILQIGANIIDQYDPDSFPTAIMMGVTPGTYTTVFGIENLPYITRILAASYQDFDLEQSHAYLETEVWNPHQASLSPSPASLVPTQIRFKAVSDPDNPASSYTSPGGHCSIISIAITGTTATVGAQPPTDLAGSVPIVFNNSSSFDVPTLLTESNSMGGASPPADKPTYYATVNPTSYALTAYQAFLYGMDIGWHDTSNGVPFSSPVGTYFGTYNTAPWSTIYIDRTPQVTPVSLDNFDLECLVNGSWRPYTVARNIAWGMSTGIRPFITPYQGALPGTPNFNFCCKNVGGPADGFYWEWVHQDPRTDRFGVSGRMAAAACPGEGSPFTPAPNSRTRWAGVAGVNYYPVPTGLAVVPTVLPALGITSYMPYVCAAGTTVSNPAQTSAFFMESSYSPGSNNNPLNANAGIINPIVMSILPTTIVEHGRFMETIGDNLAPPFAPAGQTSLNYYEDPDGVTRPGAGAYTQSGNGTDGRPMSMNANYSAMTGTSQPIVLNRPFRSVADLGYTFRDEPWKDIDFFTNVSGDAALLEAFSIDDTTAAVTAGTAPLVAGKINLNSQNATVLQALIYGAIRDDTSTAAINTISQADATRIAQALVNRTGSSVPGAGPLLGKEDLVSRFSADLNTPVYASSSDAVIKRRREAAIRGLADAGSVRTWNLMIDIITQAGKFNKSSTSGDQFAVEGERHYWLHLALDRITGKIIDEFLEPVND